MSDILNLPPLTHAVDVNVWLSHWPFRRVQLDETAALTARLASLGITQAWAGSFDGLLHRDIEGVNARLADECRRQPNEMLLPFGTINPMLPDWEEDIRRCHEVHKMPGVRLHPNYHGYKLDDPLFARVVELCTARRMIVQIAVLMEDERTQHPLVRVIPVDLAPLPQVVGKFPAARIVLLNALRTARGEPITSLNKIAQVFLDISGLEGVGGIANVIERFPVERLLFGSYAPLFYPESACMKLQESAVAGEALKMITGQNARGLLTSG